MKSTKLHSIKTLIGIVALSTFLVAGTGWPVAAQQPVPPPATQGQVPNAPLPPDQLQKLVAPIALYPDSLVAQILAAATYPTQIVEAQRFLQQNPGLSGADLGSAVDKQDWDPSVKALTAFPSVLSDMDRNLSWTSELGDANYNQSADVMNAIQVMRKKAQEAGNLNSGPQQTISDDADGDVGIAPTNPEVVYVPVYNPDFAFGYSVGMWPGFDPWWDMEDPYFSFGMGIGMGPFFGYGWGWNNWSCGWGRHGGLMYGGNRHYSHSGNFYDRNSFMHGNYGGYANRGGGGRGFVSGAEHGGSHAFAGGGRGSTSGGGGRGGAFGSGGRGGAFGGGNTRAVRGFSGGHSTSGLHSGAFGGFNNGGVSRSYSSRGMSSTHSGFGGGFGGGGGFHGGGGGFGGGGFHGGGGGFGGGGGGGFHGGGGHR